MTCFLAAAALLFAATQALATERQTQSPQGLDATNAMTHSASHAGRWAAVVDRRGVATGLVISDQHTGRSWRLADFEAIGVVHAHWIGPNSLEVDFAEHAVVLQVRAPENGGEPTFHLVTTEFNVQGVGRVDYFSPPLAARFDDTVPLIGNEPGARAN